MNTPTQSVIATGLLKQFNQAELISVVGIHLQRTLQRSFGEPDPLVGLAIAMVARATELGSVCLPVGSWGDIKALLVGDEAADPQVAALQAQLQWPDHAHWLEAIQNSALVNRGDAPASGGPIRPLRLVQGQLYLERTWQDQEVVANKLIERLTQPAPRVDEARLSAAAAQVLAGRSEEQAAAVVNTVRTWTSVITGGPGTGKTTTVEALLSMLDRLADATLRVGLAAFSGKAAARLDDSLQMGAPAAATRWANLQVDRASTIHRLLGWRGRDFVHGHDNPLHHDVLIIDEVSMLSLPLMVKLIDALRPTCRLVLLGDPDQLTSIEVGTVLADVVNAGLPAQLDDGIGSGQLVSRLTRNFRSPAAIQTLAAAVRAGEADAVLEVLHAGKPEVEFVEADAGLLAIGEVPGLARDVVNAGATMLQASLAGRADEALMALDRHRVLCGHSDGPYGVTIWTAQVERLLQAKVPSWGLPLAATPGSRARSEWYPARPLLITSNSTDLGVFNGDTGVVVVDGDRLLAAIGTPGQFKAIRPSVLDAYQSLHAMTVHKSQGSQYGTVSLIMPPDSSPLLTRELLYTALTRAKKRVRIIGTTQAITTAVNTPVRRASGLTQRLTTLLERGGGEAN